MSWLEARSKIRQFKVGCLTPTREPKMETPMSDKISCQVVVKAGGEGQLVEVTWSIVEAPISM